MKTIPAVFVSVAVGVFLHGCALMHETPNPLGTPASVTNVVRPSPPKIDRPPKMEVGHASWYGPKFHGKKTASGVIFDQQEFTAAHRNLPLGSRVRVTNLENAKFVEVEINDRGPFVPGRIIDLSRAAAKELGMLEDGVTPVRVEVLSLPEDAKL
ncbi:MAG TPA: septal ring lytic transglycosylase RlpA family protein [Candidatus Binatia bacterium]|nr:septal ring lytic transglycosylase RlpA family protein [Candidatus Binatia bacterium]